MKLDSTHPLAVWLEKHDESVVDFAERTEQSFSQLYALMGGRIRKLLASTLIKIQTGTGGEVTVSEMMRWTEENYRKPERKSA